MKRDTKKAYRQLIETHRDVLTDDEMEVFLTLYEQLDAESAAAELGMTIDQLQEVVERYFPKKAERRTRKGELYRKRLSDIALRQILDTTPNLTEKERETLQAMIGADNQVVAAMSLNMKYSAFIKQYSRIRDEHGF